MSFEEGGFKCPKEILTLGDAIKFFNRMHEFAKEVNNEILIELFEEFSNTYNMEDKIDRKIRKTENSSKLSTYLSPTEVDMYRAEFECKLEKADFLYKLLAASEVNYSTEGKEQYTPVFQNMDRERIKGELLDTIFEL